MIYFYYLLIALIFTQRNSAKILSQFFSIALSVPPLGGGGVKSFRFATTDFL